MCTASAPEVGQSSSYGDIPFSNPATEAAAAFASPASRVLPVATVMPLHSSHAYPSAPSVQPTSQWPDQQSPATAEPSVDYQRSSATPAAYFPVTVHWFYCRSIELRQIWQPFSVKDSTNLELAYQSVISGKLSIPDKAWFPLPELTALVNGPS